MHDDDETSADVDELAAANLPPVEVMTLAETAREYVARAVGMELDLTPETLPVVDHYLSMLREGGEARPELLPLIAGPVGAYFGEVVRARIGGFWHMPSDDPASWLVCTHSVVLAFSPVQIVLEVVGRGDEDVGPPAELRLLPEHREAVSRRLEALPAVRDEEYYMLSTRFEVLELVYEEILTLMQRENEHGVRLEWSDYEVLFRQRVPSA
jgi:hypothetical protein